MKYKRFSKNTWLLTGAFLLVACSGGDGGSGMGAGNSSIALSWTAPMVRADKTALLLSDITGYRIYYGVEKGRYLRRVDVDDSSATQATVSNIPSGKYFVVMTTVVDYGLESEYSPEQEVIIK